GAEKAGLKKGDVIIRIDNQQINSFAELTGYISTKRPDDVVNVYVIRGGKEIETAVKLTKSELLTAEFFGMEVEDLSASDKKKLGIDYGVKIKESDEFEDVKGKIVLSINGVKVPNTQALNQIMSRKRPNSPTRIDLLNQNGEIERYIIR